MAYKSNQNCLDCKNEFIDPERSGDKNARLCRACWDDIPSQELIDWIKASIVNEVGICSHKAKGCPAHIPKE